MLAPYGRYDPPRGARSRRVRQSLTKDEARARLLELEEDQEKTFFEIGGVLSAIQKHKWFEPFGSLDEWVKKNTTIKRSRARAWIQIYDVIVKSGVTWAKVKHLGWTKLNAIAGVRRRERRPLDRDGIEPQEA